MVIEHTIELYNSKQCIICKESSEIGPLYYFAKIHHNKSLAEAFLGVHYPVLIITACGHVAHKNCLPIRNSQCMLCKNAANILFPSTKPDEFLP